MKAGNTSERCRDCVVFKSAHREPLGMLRQQLQLILDDLGVKSVALDLINDQQAQSERTSRIGANVSSIIHEINNLIGGMRGFAQLAEMTREPDDLEKSLDTTIKVCDKLHDLWESIRELNRHGDRERHTNIKDAVELLILFMRYESEGRIEIDGNAGQMLWTSIDPIVVQVALLQLCKVIIHSVPDRSSIRIQSMRQADIAEISILARTPINGGVSERQGRNILTNDPQNSGRIPEDVLGSIREALQKTGSRLEVFESDAGDVVAYKVSIPVR